MAGSAIEGSVKSNKALSMEGWTEVGVIGHYHNECTSLIVSEGNHDRLVYLHHT